VKSRDSEPGDRAKPARKLTQHTESTCLIVRDTRFVSILSIAWGFSDPR
jgi:hypothetical protein